MAKRYVSSLCAVLAILSLASTVLGGNDFYRVIERDVRKCAAPECGGYYIEKVNAVSSRLYVAGIDYSHAPEGVESKVEDFLAVVYDGPLVVYGELVPLDDDSFNLSNLKVDTAYLGMPGQTSDLNGLTFYTLKTTRAAAEPITVAEKLNNPDVPPTPIAASSVKAVQAVEYADLGWQRNQIIYRGALVAGTTTQGSNSLSTIDIKAVYIQLPIRSFPCPKLLPVLQCDEAEGGTVVYTRTSNYCLFGSCVYETDNCPLFFPECPTGYQLAGWPAAPGGCPEYKCDPIFAPGPSIIRFQS